MKIVRKNNYKLGDRVVRGRDWKWYNQDCNIYGKQLTGVIVKHKGDNPEWVMVDWYDNDRIIHSNDYRVGYEDKYDLYFAEPSTFKIDMPL